MNFKTMFQLATVIFWFGSLLAESPEDTLFLFEGEDGTAMWGVYEGRPPVEEGFFCSQLMAINLPVPGLNQSSLGSLIAVQKDGVAIIVRGIVDWSRRQTVLYGLRGRYPSDLSLHEPQVLAELDFVLEAEPKLGWLDGFFVLAWLDRGEPVARSSSEGKEWEEIRNLDYEVYESIPLARMDLDGYAERDLRERLNLFDGQFTSILSLQPCPYIIKTHDSGQSPQNVFNFIITCDGFTFSEQVDFFESARKLTDFLVQMSPFCFHKDLFNVYAVGFVSRDSGYDSSPNIDDRDTPFGAYKIPNTNTVMTRLDAMAYAQNVLGGAPLDRNYYGWIMFNPPKGESVEINQWEDSGVPLGPDHVEKIATLHEFLHTNRWNLGDHERHASGPLDPNKTDQAVLTSGGNHPWQAWFDFSGTGSRLIRTTDAYRNGLSEWVQGGNLVSDYESVAPHPYNTYYHDPNYVSALDLLNVNLWESEFIDVDNLNSHPLFRPLWSCAMNSIRHEGPLLCPACSEQIVRVLCDFANRPFSVLQMVGQPGAVLEVVLDHPSSCPGPGRLKHVDINQTVFLDGNPLGASNSYFIDGSLGPIEVLRFDMSSIVQPNHYYELEIRPLPTRSGDIWLPGIQILNHAGARLPIHPLGEELIWNLRQQSTSTCDFEFYDLKRSPLIISFDTH